MVALCWGYVLHDSVYLAVSFAQLNVKVLMPGKIKMPSAVWAVAQS